MPGGLNATQRVQVVPILPVYDEDVGNVGQLLDESLIVPGLDEVVIVLGEIEHLGRRGEAKVHLRWPGVIHLMELEAPWPTLTCPSKAASPEISILMMRSPGVSVMSVTRRLISSRWRFMRSATPSVWTTARILKPSCSPATLATRLGWTWPRMISRASRLYTGLPGLRRILPRNHSSAHANVLYCDQCGNNYILI